MPVFRYRDREFRELAPGVVGWLPVNGASGAVGITAGRVVFEPGAVLHGHTHNVEEAIQVIAGRARVRLGGEVLEVGPGDVILAPAGVPHQTENIGEEELILAVAFASAQVERVPADLE